MKMAVKQRLSVDERLDTFFPADSDNLISTSRSLTFE